MNLNQTAQSGATIKTALLLNENTGTVMGRAIEAKPQPQPQPQPSNSSNASKRKRKSADIINLEDISNTAKQAANPVTCLHHIFEQQAIKTPDKPAIERAEQSWTYQEIECRANRLAHFLRKCGVKKDTFVGLTLNRSEWPIISILAVLKAGGAYIPLDPTLPIERKRYIIDEVGFALLLTDEANEPVMNQFETTNLATLEEFLDTEKSYPETPLPQNELSPTPNSVCYTLFTSGTTGRPKGVVTEHRNTVHFVQAFNEVCDTNENDRVFQGFSLGFDGSVEEMWMAFSNGATLVCGEKLTPQFGAELGDFIEEKQITFFSTVPTLLSTLPQKLLNVRQLVVSGEACHPDLVKHWAMPYRIMYNVYGPTEATVNTTASILEQGKEVTIGQPLPGYDLYILDEKLNPVEAGQKGELYIGGDGISRGYMNQPELTSKTYIDWPDQTSENISEEKTVLRLYKTGDLVRWNEQGELEFFGRIDSQVKLRGFRIELSEIEAVILEHDEISAATVKVCDHNGLQSLAAYVLLSENAVAVDRNAVLKTLRDRLPTYMIPSFLEVMETFPRVPSGKVNKAALPEPTSHLVAEADPNAEPLTEMEAEIAAIWAEQFGVPTVGADQNYFTELGGHSLLAAQMVGSLYKKLNRKVNVRDLYIHPTVRKLAAELQAQDLTSENTAQSIDEPKEQVEKLLRPWTWSALIVQSLYFLSIMPLLTLPVVLVLPTAMTIIENQTSPWILIPLAFALFAGTWTSLIVIAIVAKWVLIGRYRPGRHPLWGSFYIRWWLASRLQHLSFISAFNGTPFAALLWRAMGAKVGKHCVLNPSLVYAWDCVRIGNHVSIGKDTQMPCLRMEDGYLIIGELEIGDRCFIGNHSTLGLNAKMGADARLDDQSQLPDNFSAKETTHYRGSPPVAGTVPVPTAAENEPAAITSNPVKVGVFGIIQITAATLVTALTVAPVTLAIWLVSMLALHYPASVSVPAFVLSVPVTLLVFTFWSAFCKKLVHPNPKPGTYKVYSFQYLQHWLAELVMQIVRLVGLSIFTTLYLPPWMRMLGAKLGKHTEMSTVWNINPDMVEAGDSVFFADGSMVGGSRTHLGRFLVEKNTIGDRSFIGNSAILSAGNSIGSDCLLGVLSSTPDQEKPIEDGTDWLGSPGFQLPNRDKVTCYDQKLTYKPSMKLYAQRAIIDGLRVVLPGYIILGFAIASLFTVIAVYDNYGVWGAYTAIPLLTWGAIIVSLITVVGLKWMIMGRFKPTVQPLWSSYVWWNEFINGMYESLLSPWISNFFGTPFAAIFLRLMGCKIGKYCYIETDLFSEFDLVNVGDYAALNAGVVIQNHLFEDRVMKSSYVNIGKGCTVGNMSVVLYDSTMEEGAVLGPMSLLMKGEHMPAKQNWYGIPTIQQN